MVSQLRQQIDQISREKNINPEIIIAAIEDAILTASKKYYRGAEDLRSRFNNESGLIEVFAVKQIVENVEIPETQITLQEAQTIIPEAEVGQEIEFPKPTDVLGRIAAQTAKQVIFQKVREAERDNVFAEYSNRVGEVLNGIIKRQEMGDFVVELGRAEALLPRKEQSRAETYQTGDRVRVFNGRGSCVLAAEVTGAVPAGVVRATSVRWNKRAPDRRNVNVLTSDRLTDIGGGPVFYSCLVEVEKCAT